MEVRRASRWYSFAETVVHAPRRGLPGAGEVTARGLCEIVAADRLVESMGALRRARHAGSAGRRADTLRLDEPTQDRQRQIGVAALDRLIEPVRQFALA